MPEGGLIRFDLMSDEQVDVLLEGAFAYQRSYAQLGFDASGDSGYDPDRDRATYDLQRDIIYASLRELGTTDPARLQSLIPEYMRSKQPHKQQAALFTVDGLFDYDEDFTLETLAFFQASPWEGEPPEPIILDDRIGEEAYSRLEELEDGGQLTEERARKLNLILARYGAELYAFGDYDNPFRHRRS